MYSPTPCPRERLRPRFVIATAAAALLAGCITYTPQQVARMPAYDLCEAQLYSRVNLTAETRTRVNEEIARRRENCSAQVPLIEADRAAETEQHMYENSGP